MATYQIFITGEDVEDRQLGINSSYSYQDGFLRIFNKDRVVYFEEPQKGDAFVVICERGKIFLKKMVPPQRRGSLIAWLLRFNMKNRATSLDDYNRKINGQRKRRYWEGYKEKEYKSDGYVFTLCNSPFDRNYRNVAGFISDAVTKKEILGLIPLMVHHPDWYVKKILWESFEISENEFEEARTKTFTPL